jgi:ABC-2 type transport system ATP-binding protein
MRVNQPSASPSATPSLEIRGLCKQFPKGPLANDDIDLVIHAGEVFGLLGPNGAGKTTLVKQVIGLLKPSSGSITLDGHDLIDNPALARQLVTYLPQGALPLDSLTPRQAINLVGRIRGGDRDTVARRADELIDALELGPWTDTLGLKLSGGVKRLVGYIMATIWPASVVVLDEPTNDVDPLRRQLLWRLIRRLGREGISVLLVTHNVLEAEQAVDRLAVIDGGRILAQGTPSSLKAEDRQCLRLRLNLTPGTDDPELPAFISSHMRLGGRLHLLIDETRAVEGIEWARAQMDAGRAEEYALGAATLEDTYIRLIGRNDALDLAGEQGGTA